MQIDGDLDELVRRIKAGDSEAYRDVVSLVEAKVRISVAAILMDRELVSDVTQEAFVRAYFKLTEYKEGTNFVAWIRQIAKNIAFNERKKFMRKLAFQKRYQSEIEEETQPVQEEIADSLTDNAVTALRACLDAMQPPARDVVGDFYFRKKSCREISQSHARSEPWTRIVLHRAREALAKCMNEKGVMEYGNAAN